MMRVCGVLRLVALCGAFFAPAHAFTPQDGLSGYTRPWGALQRQRGRGGVVVTMGRRFENNKVKMAKSAAAYTKKAAYVGKKIAICVREGGPNPEANRQLALLMKEAKTMGVSSDVVERNIKKASEKPTDYKELTYEAYGVGGVGFIINCLSDNNNRANAQVNAAIGKCKGFKAAASGSVLFNFEKKARMTVDRELTEDDLIDIAIAAGVDDVDLAEPDSARGDDEEKVKAVVLAPAGDLGNMREALEATGMACTGQLINSPLTLVECGEADLEANLAGLDRLEEVEDVDSVEHNMAL